MMVTLAIVEWEGGRRPEALNLYRECASLCEQTDNQYLTGTYHMNYALALRTAGMTDSSLN